LPTYPSTGVPPDIPRQRRTRSAEELVSAHEPRLDPTPRGFSEVSDLEALIGGSLPPSTPRREPRAVSLRSHRKEYSKTDPNNPKVSPATLYKLCLDLSPARSNMPLVCFGFKTHLYIPLRRGTAAYCRIILKRFSRTPEKAFWIAYLLNIPREAIFLCTARSPCGVSDSK
jgi:hypothetical protein